jgi:hypothetical protein
MTAGVNPNLEFTPIVVAFNLFFSDGEKFISLEFILH